MKSDSIKEITTALAKAQVDFLPIKRTEKVDYQTTAGRKKYEYAPLGAIIDATKKALSANGLAVTQNTKLSDGNTILETLVSHSSGEWLSGELYVGKQDMPPQSLGSALTYMRRYGMSAILCVSSEDDDDGEDAMARVIPEKKPKPLPERTEATKPVVKEQAGDNLPEEDKTLISKEQLAHINKNPKLGIDMDWVRNSMKQVRWTETTIKSYLVNIFKVSKEGSLEDVIARLNDEQKKQLCKEIQERLDMA